MASKHRSFKLSLRFIGFTYGITKSIVSPFHIFFYLTYLPCLRSYLRRAFSLTLHQRVDPPNLEPPRVETKRMGRPRHGEQRGLAQPRSYHSCPMELTLHRDCVQWWQRTREIHFPCDLGGRSRACLRGRFEWDRTTMECCSCSWLRLYWIYFKPLPF